MEGTTERLTQRMQGITRLFNDTVQVIDATDARLAQRMANLQRLIDRSQVLVRLFADAVQADADAFEAVDATTQQGLAALEERLRATLARPGVVALKAACVDAPSADDDCCICLEGAGALSLTRCGHVFHFECIHAWTLTGKRGCPVCRRDLIE